MEDPIKVQLGDEDTPSLGLKWTFPHTDELFAESSNKDTTTVLSFNEKDYFEERRRVFQIEFKKEPPKAQTQAFEVSNLSVISIECWLRHVQG